MAGGSFSFKEQRTIFQTGDAGSVQLMYRTGPSEKNISRLKWYGVCFPCSGLLCMSHRVSASTFIEVYENRLAFNYPIACCGSVYDSGGSVYFDSQLLNKMEEASCLSPCFTHNSCCPDCCGLFGEVAVVYNDSSTCSTSSTCTSNQTICCLFCWMRQAIVLPGLTSAREVVSAIKYCKETRLKNGPQIIQRAPITFSAPLGSDRQMEDPDV